MEEQGDANWTEFHGECYRAHAERLCQICGEPLAYTVLLGAGVEGGKTSGPGCHPICMVMALNFCPHLRVLGEDSVAAYAYQGLGNGYLIGDPALEGHPELFESELQVDEAALPLKRHMVKEIAGIDSRGERRDLDISECLADSSRARTNNC